MDVARRIAKTMTYTRTAELQAMSMQRLGYSPARIRKEAMKIINADPEYRKAVAKNTLEYKRDVRDLINDITKQAMLAGDDLVAGAGNMSWINDLAIWKAAGKTLEDNSYLQQLIEAYSRQTEQSMKNLTKTTGFKAKSGFENIENLYRREMDKATIKVCSGAFTSEQAVRDAVKELSQSGLRSVDYASGYSMRIDTAARLAIRTGCHQISGRVEDANIIRSGEGLVYVEHHAGARNQGTGHMNHEEWQGKVYSYKEDGTDYSKEADRIGQGKIEDLWEATGYSLDGRHENDLEGLYGYNCRHQHYIWFEGISEKTDPQPEPEPVTYNGKTLDRYAQTQKMRQMERRIRALKSEKEACKKLGMDFTEVDAKISEKRREYNEFCSLCGIRPHTERLRYDCNTSDIKKTQAWKEYRKVIEETNKNVADTPKPVTLDTTEDKGNVEVHTVGKIDREKYKCITNDIKTDEVIMTDERIEHIRERHPNDYERFYSYIPQIIESPDYIVEANKENTGILLKRVKDNGEEFKLVLRIAVKEDPEDYKNSVISFWHIGDVTWRKTLKNKKILYRNE